MVRTVCLLLCCVIAAVPAISGSSGIPDAAILQAAEDVRTVRQYADQLREDNLKEDYTTGGFTWDTERRETSWRYFNGFMIDALLRLGGEENVRYAGAFYRDHILPDGSVRDYLPGYLDSVESARALFRLIPVSDSPEDYFRAIQWVYSQLESQTVYLQCGRNYLHHQEENGKPAESSLRYPIFLDGMYMTQPFLAECAASIRRGELALTDRKGRQVSAEQLEEEILNRYVWMRAYLYDPEKGLYQHGWNVTASSANGHYWGRGIGWLAMSMADVIELLPEGPGRDRMTVLLAELLDGMLAYQDPSTGMWYNVVDRGEDLPENRLETSVTAMMAYTLVKAWNIGAVTDERYLVKGLEAFHGVTEQKMYLQDGRLHVRDTYLKSGVGETDGYYCTQPYTEDEAKGTAALLMAAAEIETALGILGVPQTTEQAGQDNGKE